MPNAQKKGYVSPVPVTRQQLRERTIIRTFVVLSVSFVVGAFTGIYYYHNPSVPPQKTHLQVVQSKVPNTIEKQKQNPPEEVKERSSVDVSKKQEEALKLASLKRKANLLYKKKAKLLYDIVTLLKWPHEDLQSPRSVIRVCIIGNSAFGDYIRNTAERTISRRTRSVIVQEFYSVAQLFELERCHLVYVTDIVARRMLPLESKLLKSHTLLVSEQGRIGTLTYAQRGSNVSLEVNKSQLKQAGVQLTPISDTKV